MPPWELRGNLSAPLGFPQTNCRHKPANTNPLLSRLPEIVNGTIILQPIDKKKDIFAVFYAICKFLATSKREKGADTVKKAISDVALTKSAFEKGATLLQHPNRCKQEQTGK